MSTGVNVQRIHCVRGQWMLLAFVFFERFWMRLLLSLSFFSLYLGWMSSISSKDTCTPSTWIWNANKLKSTIMQDRCDTGPDVTVFRLHYIYRPQALCRDCTELKNWNARNLHVKKFLVRVLIFERCTSRNRLCRTCSNLLLFPAAGCIKYFACS